MGDFEKWFRSLNANGKTVYFLGNEHRVSEMAWNHQQTTINDLKAQLECCRRENAVLLGKVGELQERIDKYRKLTISIRNEFDLWSDDSEFAGVIEAQIENLEALRGAND